MYGLKRLNSLFTAAAVSPKRFFRSSPPVRSTQPSPAATTRTTYERKVLPPELSRNVLKLTCESSADGGVCDVYVVGTRHDSKESCQQVHAVVDFLKPQVVFLELCPGRAWYVEPHKLKGPRPTKGDMMEHWKENGILFGTICSGVFAKFSSENVELPTSEFQVAYEEAKKYGGKVVLGDRPVQITLRRTWAKMPLWHKILLSHWVLFNITFLPIIANLTNWKMVKEMDVDSRINFAIEMMSKQIPTIVETIRYERDQYMSATLLEVAREHTSVVAVVGKNHLPGIQKNWKQPIEVEQLLSIPSAKYTILKGTPSVPLQLSHLLNWASQPNCHISKKSNFFTLNNKILTPLTHSTLTTLNFRAEKKGDNSNGTEGVLLLELPSFISSSRNSFPSLSAS